MKMPFFSNKGINSLITLFIFSSILFSSCSSDEGGEKFIGWWKGGGTLVEITKNGDYYLWNDGGYIFGKMQLKYVDGELHGGGIAGNLTYNKVNGHIYFFGKEFEKVTMENKKSEAKDVDFSNELDRRTQEAVHYMTQRDSLESLYKFTLDKYDSVTITNNDPLGKFINQQIKISVLKREISSILRKKNASQSELSKTKTLIEELNSTITKLEGDVAGLANENDKLPPPKVILEPNLAITQSEKQVLENTVDVGSTFSASNLAITPVNEKGSKEKVTSTAKRVDKIIVSFNIENRIEKSNPTDVYLVLTAPDGKIMTSEAMGSGIFTTRQDGIKQYTAKLKVNYEQGTRQNVQFSLQDKFEVGEYKIEVYHNGFKIGEGVRNLKTSSLFQ